MESTQNVPVQVSPKKSVPMAIGIILLLIVVSGISYFLGTKSRPTVPESMTYIPTSTTKPSEEPLSITPRTTVDTTASWNTYTADAGLQQLGVNFSFKYPNGWQESIVRSSLAPWVIVSKNKVTNATIRTNYTPCVSVGGGLWPANVSIDQLFTDDDATKTQFLATDPLLIHTPKKIISKKNILVDGVQAIKRDIIRYDETEPSSQVYLEVPNAKGNGDISVYKIESCTGVSDDQFNQILSTFKFL